MAFKIWNVGRMSEILVESEFDAVWQKVMDDTNFISR